MAIKKLAIKKIAIKKLEINEKKQFKQNESLVKRVVIISCMYGGMYTALFGHMNSLAFFIRSSSVKGISRSGNFPNWLDEKKVLNHKNKNTNHIDCDFLYGIEIYPFGISDVLKKLSSKNLFSYQSESYYTDELIYNAKHYIANSEEKFIFEAHYLLENLDESVNRNEELTEIEGAEIESAEIEQLEQASTASIAQSAKEHRVSENKVSEQRAVEQTPILFKNSLDSESSLSTFFLEEFKSVVPGGAYQIVPSAELFYQSHKGCYDKKELKDFYQGYN